MKHGKGTIVYVSGSKYTGNWKEDHIDDKDGVMEYANGDCYKGEFL